MSTSASPATAAPDHLRRRSREALSGLALQFVLGMSVNLIGDPDNAGVRIFDTILLILHIIVGIGIVVAAVRILLAARAIQVGGQEALWGLIASAVAFLAGVALMIFGSDWFSFIMALGFLAAAVLYVRTYVLGMRAGGAGGAVSPGATPLP